MPTYANSAHAPKNTTPATHSTNNTTGTGNLRNHSKASPIPLDAGAVVVFGFVLGSVLGFVVSCFVVSIIAPYPPKRASVSLNCSIFYNLLCELLIAVFISTEPRLHSRSG